MIDSRQFERSYALGEVVRFQHALSRELCAACYDAPCETSRLIAGADADYLVLHPSRDLLRLVHALAGVVVTGHSGRRSQSPLPYNMKTKVLRLVPGRAV